MIENRLMEIARKFLVSKRVKPVYICISGSHLYGFPSSDSDYDIRCCHILPTGDFFHLNKRRDTFEYKTKIKNIEIEIVSHEIEKVMKLALKNNSNILEHIFAKNLLPTMEYDRLKNLAANSLSKVVYNPYRGMAVFNYEKFIRKKPLKYPLIKKYLYVLRAYMGGIYALEQGVIEPSLIALNNYFKEEIVTRLIELKKQRKEKSRLMTPREIKKTENLLFKLKARMELAKKNSKLPEKPKNEKDFDEFLYEVRLKYF